MTRLDQDTRQKGTEGRFEYWEGDHTAFVHVLRRAKRSGLTLEKDFDAIATMLLRSRAMAARIAQAIEKHEKDTANNQLRANAESAIAEAEAHERNAVAALNDLNTGEHPEERAHGLELRAKKYTRLANASRARAAEILEGLR